MDFEDVGEALFFPPGSSPDVNPESCFIFITNDDLEVEPTETAPLLASSDDPRLKFTVGGDMATVNIFDDGENDATSKQTKYGCMLINRQAQGRTNSFAVMYFTFV